MFIVYYCVYKWNLLPSTAGLRCGTRPVLAVLGTFWSDAEYLEPLTRHEWEAGGGWLGKHGGKPRALERWSLGLVYCLDDLLGSGLLLLSLFRAWWMSCPVGFWTSLFFVSVGDFFYPQQLFWWCSIRRFTTPCCLNSWTTSSSSDSRDSSNGESPGDLVRPRWPWWYEDHQPGWVPLHFASNRGAGLVFYLSSFTCC